MRREIIFITFLITLAMVLGLGIPFWPLILFAIAIAAFYAPLYVAFILALLADLTYGPPLGLMAPLVGLFFIFAVVCYFIKLFALNFILERGDSTRI